MSTARAVHPVVDHQRRVDAVREVLVVLHDLVGRTASTYGGAVDSIAVGTRGDRVRRELDGLLRRVGTVQPITTGDPAGDCVDRVLGDEPPLLGRLREPLAGRAVDQDRRACPGRCTTRGARGAPRRRSSRRRGTGSGRRASSRASRRRFGSSLPPFRSGAYSVAENSAGSCSSGGDRLGEQPRDERAEREAGRRHADVVAGERVDSPTTGCRSFVNAMTPVHVRTTRTSASLGITRIATADVAGRAVPDRRVARAGAAPAATASRRR